MLGPVIFVLGIYSEIEIYMSKKHSKNKNETLKLSHEYYPLFQAYGSLIFCSFVSGLCAFLRFGVYHKNYNRVIKLGRMASFLAKALCCQIPVFFFYNADPMGWRTKNGLFGPWGPIELPFCTCLYCVVGQPYFVRRCNNLVNETKEVVNFLQGVARKVQKNKANN